MATEPRRQIERDKQKNYQRSQQKQWNQSSNVGHTISSNRHGQLEKVWAIQVDQWKEAH